MPLPVVSAFLAIFRISNVTSESQQPGLRLEGGEGANFTPPGHWARGRREEETTSTSHVEICVDIPLLNLIVNEWFIADRGEDLVIRPAIICLADWKLGEKSSPLASLNLQHFAIYE